MSEPTLQGPPRTPTVRATHAYFQWHGMAKTQLMTLIAVVLISPFFAALFSLDLVLDWFISANPRETRGKVISQELAKDVKVLGERPTRIRFAYKINGETLESRITTTDQEVLYRTKPGASVIVEYDAEDPHLARIKGTSYATFGLFGALSWIPVGGGVLALLQILRNRKAQQDAYRTGSSTLGRITFAGPDPRYAHWKKTPVHRITWEYTAGGRTYLGHWLTDEPDKWLEFKIGSTWPVLYNQAKPSQSVLYV